MFYWADASARNIAWLWLRWWIVQAKPFFFGHEMCNFTSVVGRNGNENHQASRCTARASASAHKSFFILNIEKVLRNVSNNKRQHSTFFTIRKKSQAAADAKSKWAKIENRFALGYPMGNVRSQSPGPGPSGEEKSQQRQTRKGRGRAARFWVSWLHQFPLLSVAASKDNLWVSDRHRPPNFLSKRSVLRCFGLLINIIGSVLCDASYDRKLCIKSPETELLA